MTVSFTNVAQLRAGTRKLHIVKLIWDGDAYAAGGIAITAANLGFVHSIDTVIPIYHAASAGGSPIGLFPLWDNTDKKLTFFWPSGGSASPAGLDTAPAVTVPSGAVAVTSDAAQPNLVETAGVGRENTLAMTAAHETFLLCIGF